MLDRVKGYGSAGARLFAFAFHQIWKLLFERFDFGPGANLDVGIVGVLVGIVLVVGLSVVKAFQGDYLSDDRPTKCVGGVELLDICITQVTLLVAAIEDD
jgi:hypothetical protein